VTIPKSISIQEDIPVYGMPDQIDIAMDTKVFPFEKLQDAMIQLKQRKIKEPNAVIKMPTPTVTVYKNV